MSNDTTWQVPDAPYLITWRTSCWPLSINLLEPAQERYCHSSAEVEAWKQEYKKWASLEGNKVDYCIWVPDADNGFKLVVSSWY